MKAKQFRNYLHKDNFQKFNNGFKIPKLTLISASLEKCLIFLFNRNYKNSWLKILINGIICMTRIKTNIFAMFLVTNGSNAGKCMFIDNMEQ